MSIGLSPAQFWTLSALEWRWLSRGGETAITLSDALALARLYPDEKHE